MGKANSYFVFRPIATILAAMRRALRKAKCTKLAKRVTHVAVEEGDGAGYDVRSFEVDGAVKLIEVKTTRGGPDTDFFVSANEVRFSETHPDSFSLYRVYNCDPEARSGIFFEVRGSLRVHFTLDSTQYRARRSKG